VLTPVAARIGVTGAAVEFENLIANFIYALYVYDDRLCVDSSFMMICKKTSFFIKLHFGCIVVVPATRIRVLSVPVRDHLIRLEARIESCCSKVFPSGWNSIPNNVSV
jgi:hypothetical protein